MIKLLSVAIVAGLIFESQQQLPSLSAVLAAKPAPCNYPPHIHCWTEWFDRDNPSGTGDWEHLSALRAENPGKICPNPVDIEVQTLSGLSVAAAGDVIYKNDVTTGFICRNSDQKKGQCNDYRVRFSCDPPYCAERVCWTQWFDRDNPSGSGDWEHLSALRFENPGKICTSPFDIEAQTLSGVDVAATGDVIYKNDVTTGFICKNSDQTTKKWCNDYRVRFRCNLPFCGEGVCWTKWFDRDHPSGTGDWELLSNLRTENPGEICANPLYIEVVTTGTTTPAAVTGENFYILNPSQGFVCRKKDQSDGQCLDYKVRFGCPCI